MPDRDGYIPGVPCWADTSQPDPAAAAEFYSGLFGWEMEDVMPPEAGGAKYFMGRVRGRDVAAVGSIPEALPQIATWNTYVWVDSADESASKARDAGGSILMEPFDVMESGRMAFIADPEGAALGIWEAREHKGSQVVNEHGTVVFNDLHTRDPGAAKRFYGEVFGWGTLDLGGAEMWTLEGYGDHLEEIAPGTRANQDESGAPPGFVDVVASIIPIGDDERDTPAHWGVTFGVDDADATADRAKQLGGELLVAPHDAPWVRASVIRDPQGATFNANQYVPENKDLPAERSAGAEA